MPNKTKVNYKQLEELAATLPSNSAICRKLGKSINFVNMRCKADAEFNAAIERGRSRFVNGSGIDEPKIEKSSEPNKIAKIAETDFTELDEGIKKAIRWKFYFLHDIAVFVAQEKQTVYQRLSLMVAAGEVLRDRNGEAVSYRLAETDIENAEISEPDNLSKHPNYPYNLTDGEIQEMILTAIDNLHCLLSQIKRFNDFPLSFNLAEYLERMIDKGEIVQITNEPLETLTAFFRKEKVPKRFWHAGNCLGVEWFGNNEKPRESKADSIIESDIKSHLPESRKNRGELPTDLFGGKRYKRPEAVISAGDVERFAAEDPNQKILAEKLNIGFSTIYLKFRDSPELKAAYQRGKEKFEANKNKAKANDVLVEKEIVEPVTEVKSEMGCPQAENECAEKFGSEFEFGEDRKNYDFPQSNEDFKFPENEPESFVVSTDDVQAAPMMDKRDYEKPVQIEQLSFGDEKVDVQAAPMMDKEVSEPKLETKGFAGCTNCGMPFSIFPNHIAADGKAFCGTDCQMGYFNRNYAVSVHEISSEASEIVPSGVEVNERFAHTIETLTREGKPSRESIERITRQLTEPKSLPEIEVLTADILSVEEMPEPQITTIELSSGSLDMSLNINLFEADDEEFRFLFDITRRVREFKQRRAA